MIQPVNEHLLIEPIPHKTFLESEDGKGIYEEIGIVVKIGNIPSLKKEYALLKAGDKVYFDAWEGAKYPTGEEGKFFWLVKWSDVKAIENKNEEHEVSELPVSQGMAP